MKTYRDRFYESMDALEKKGTANTEVIRRAFLLAEKLHEGQFRKSGEEYIIHPVEVMIILEKLGFEDNVLVAALLHDVIEDCGMTHADLKMQFNEKVADIVEACSEIQNEDIKNKIGGIYEEEDFLTHAKNNKTYQKLIQMGKKNKIAFFIKFADRLHNLRTIQYMPRYKQLDKIQETRAWIIPLAKLFGAEYFSKELSNLCYIIQHKELLVRKLTNYNLYHSLNNNLYADIKKNLLLTTAASLVHSKTNIIDCMSIPMLAMDVFESILNVFPAVNTLEHIKQSHYNKIVTNNLYILLDTMPEEISRYDLIFDILKKSKSFLRIIDCKYDENLDSYIFILKDNYRNRYSFQIMTAHQYYLSKVGDSAGTDIDSLDDNSISEVVTKFITVYTRKGESIKMPENSTVLDFAFKLHKIIGLSCKCGLINNSTTKSPPYTRLNNGDKVEIITEVDENGEKKNIAKLRSIAYAKTEYAQKILIRHFEDMTDM